MVPLSAPPNIGMHPTANSAAFIRKTWMLVQLCARRVMPGVRLLRVEFEERTRDLSPVSGARLLAVQLKAHVRRHAAALPHPLDKARRALNNSFRGCRRVLIGFKQRAAEQRHAPDRT